MSGAPLTTPFAALPSPTWLFSPKGCTQATISFVTTPLTIASELSEITKLINMETFRKIFDPEFGRQGQTTVTTNVQSKKCITRQAGTV